MAGNWSPWKRRDVEGFAPVVQVEILSIFADAVERIARRLGMSPGATLNSLLAAGIAIHESKEGDPLPTPEVPPS